MKRNPHSNGGLEAAGIGGKFVSVLGIGGVSGMIAFPTTSNRIMTVPMGTPGAGSGGVGVLTNCGVWVFSFRYTDCPTENWLKSMTTSIRDDTLTSSSGKPLVALQSAGVSSKLPSEATTVIGFCTPSGPCRLKVKGNTTPVLMMRKRY